MFAISSLFVFLFLVVGFFLKGEKKTVKVNENNFELLQYDDINEKYFNIKGE